MLFKYVIFIVNHSHPQFMPVLAPDHVPHSMIKLDEPALIYSAGFAKQSGCYDWEVSKATSGSLSLGPSRHDSALLRSFGVMAFLCDNYLGKADTFRVQRKLLKLAKLSAEANKPINLTEAALAGLALNQAAIDAKAAELTAAERAGIHCPHHKS